MKLLDLSFGRISALGYAPGYRVQQVQKARHSVETTRSKKAHPPACRARVEGEEMIQSEPKSASDLTVCVRRHPSGGPTAVYRFSDIDGFHRGRVSDDVGRETSHEALFGYVIAMALSVARWRIRAATGQRLTGSKSASRKPATKKTGKRSRLP